MQDEIKKIYLMPIGALLLSFVGGFMEGYTYVLRGGVFCNAQTGNIALMMINFSKNNPFMWAHFFSLLAFICGIFISNFSFLKNKVIANIISQDSILMFEIVVLIFICFVPPGDSNIWISTTISFVSAMQYNAFKKVDDILYSSVFCTNNIRQATLYFFDYLVQGDKVAWTTSRKYVFIVLFFALGVLVASLLTTAFGQYSLFLAVFLLIALFILDKYRKKRFNQNTL